MAIEVTSGNSTLIQSQVASLLVQPLEQASTFLAAGPVVLDSSSPVRVPRIVNGVTAGFVAEGAQISDGDVAFDEVTLLPSTLKGLKVLVKLSNELIRTSVVGLDAVLRTRLVTDVANALDAALWDGAGTSNTIKGILRATGITTGTLDLTDPDSLIDGLATAQGNKVSPTHWVMTAASFAEDPQGQGRHGRQPLRHRPEHDPERHRAASARPAGDHHRQHPRRDGRRTASPWSTSPRSSSHAMSTPR